MQVDIVPMLLNRHHLLPTWPVLLMLAVLNLSACQETNKPVTSAQHIFGTWPRAELTATTIQFTTAEETALEFSLPVSASHGLASVLILELPVNGALKQSGTRFVYTPAPDFNGIDSLTFAASQSGQTSLPATASIVVTPINDAPQAKNIAIVTSKDMPFTGVFNADDPEGDRLSFSVVTASSHGTVVIDTLLQTFHFTPTAGFIGETHFYYRADDGLAPSNTARVDVLVLDNDPPVLSSVQIAGGAAGIQYLNTTLSIAADASASDMRLSGDLISPDTAWRPFAATTNIQLTPGDGLKVVRVQVRDYLNNKSAVVTDTITLDQQGPVVNLGYPSHTSQPTISVAVAVTDPSPPISMRVRGQISAATPINIFNAFGPVVNNIQITLSGKDAPKAVTLEFQDGFGQRSTEVISIVLDRQAPTGLAKSSLLFIDPVMAAANPLSSVAEVTTVTNLRNLPVTAAWNDATSPVTAVILWGDITNAGFFDLPAAAQTTAGTSALAELPTLTNGDGNKQLYGRVVDAAGNRGPLFSFLVTLDTTPPTLSSVVLAGGAAAISSPTPGFATVTLAVNGVNAAFSLSITTPANIAGPFLLSPPFALTYYTALPTLIYAATSGQVLQAWARVFDRAGNASAIKGDSVLLDNVAPMCTPSANPVSVTSASRQTTLTFCAGNVASQGVTQILLSGHLDGAPYSLGAVNSMPVTLTTGNGPKTITVVLKDAAGNADHNTLNLYLNVPPFTAMVTPTATFLDFVTGITKVVQTNGGNEHYLGSSVLWLPDLSGDGLADLAIGVTGANSGDGEVSLRSGTTLAALSSLAGTTLLAGEFGTALALADINHDGKKDLLVSAPKVSANRGVIYAYNLVDNSLIRSSVSSTLSLAANSMFGAAIAGSADLSGDGIDDVLVGAPGSGAGRVECRSGANFDSSVFTAIAGLSNGDRLGTAVISVGDINGDTWPEFVAGAAPASVSGYALLISGGNRSTLQTLRGANHVNNFGAALALLQSGHQRRLAIGAPREVSSANTVGAVYLFDLSTGQRHAVRYGGRHGERFGAALANIGDWNSDGWPDLAVGAPEANDDGHSSGSIYVLSGSDLQVLLHWNSGTGIKRLGQSLAGGANVNGNYLTELVAGAPQSSAGGSNSGSALLLTPATLPRYAAAGTMASFNLIAAPSIVTVQANLDGGSWQTLDDFTVYFYGITEGGHYAQFRGFSAYGELGPTSSFNWQSDQTPPQMASITQPGDGSTTSSKLVAGSVTDSVHHGVGGQIRGIRWAVKQTAIPNDLWWDGYSFSSLLPYYFFDFDGAAWQFTGPYSTAGTYEVIVKGLDGAFNHSATTSSTFTYTPP